MNEFWLVDRSCFLNNVQADLCLAAAESGGIKGAMEWIRRYSPRSVVYMGSGKQVYRVSGSTGKLIDLDVWKPFGKSKRSLLERLVAGEKIPLPDGWKLVKVVDTVSSTNGHPALTDKWVVVRDVFLGQYADLHTNRGGAWVVERHGRLSLWYEYVAGEDTPNNAVLAFLALGDCVKDLGYSETNFM